MLYIVGLGLAEGEITVKGREMLEKSDRAYVEFYTNTETVDIASLETETGTEIERLERSEVEQDMVPVEEAGEEDVAFLVSGDPLTATTHFQLKKEAESRGIDVEVAHAPSIVTSVAETGLDVYKFGRTVTVPEEGATDSIVDMIEKNDSVGLHTVVLFDIDLGADEAAEKLVEADSSLADRECVVVERANSEDQSFSVSRLSRIKDEDLGETPHCLVIVGETSFKEEEFLEELE